jgi:hypothetical protein
MCAFHGLGSLCLRVTKYLSAEPTDPFETATLVEDDTSGTNFGFQSLSTLPGPEIVPAAGSSILIRSQTPISAQLPWKRLKLGPLKGWGVQHDSTVDCA